MASPRRQVQQQREQSTRRRANPAPADVDRHSAQGPDGNATLHAVRGSFGVRVTRPRHTSVTHHDANPRASPDSDRLVGLRENALTNSSGRPISPAPPIDAPPPAERALHSAISSLTTVDGR